MNPATHTLPYLLGIDYGTESCRVAVFDAAGTPVSFAATSYPTSYPQSGWAEQDVDDWYRALVSSAHEALSRAGIDPTLIAGIGFAATSASVVSLDSDGMPLRPAIMWMDVRAAAHAARTTDVLDAMATPGRAANVPASAELFPFKAAWLKEHEPETYRRTAYLLDAPDWLGYRLTGRLRTNENSAAAKMYHDRSVGGFPRDFYTAIGCLDALDKLPVAVEPLGTLLGHLTKATAADLGLPAGIPVAEGCIDAYAGQIGLNVLAPGKMALITGSSHVLLGQAPLEFADSGATGAFADAVLPGQCSVEAAIVSSGSAIRWFRDTFARDLVQAASAGGPSAYDVLNAEAAGIPEGSDGLIAVPYFQGCRAPEADSKARAILWGLSLSHSRAHIYRALQEGICYAVADNLRRMHRKGYQVHELVACGGALNSPTWMQMHADITGLPIALTKVQDAVALGACVMAASAGGVYSSVEDAADAMVHRVRRIEPDLGSHERYQPFLDAYVDTYPRLVDLQHDMTDRATNMRALAADSQANSNRTPDERGDRPGA